MHQKATVQASASPAHPGRKLDQRLGPLLCWAVVFADIGTSIYYVPGILYQNVGSLAGFFVFLTMIVFILLTLKYVEVTYRFPQGGGVVTVSTKALNHWFGALGGMFILVDYFLTAAISALSGILYLSVVVPTLGPQTTILGLSVTVWVTLLILVLLGILNWVGVSASAKVSLVGAAIAFVSDVAVLVTVFAHISPVQFFALLSKVFSSGHALSPAMVLVGFSGSFLAFSGLESISQLSPVMKVPRRKVSGIALFLVVLTVGLTSPLLTLFATLLLPREAADPVLSSQLISLLGGKWGGVILRTEVAVSASALLVFASNTAIIGTYHVFLALSRMQFFPKFLLQRNRLRGTPHFAIALAVLIPILVLLIVHGDINLLGDMYAFGLLGAFTLTSLSIDVVRSRQRKARTDSQPAAPTDEEAPEDPNEQPEPEGVWARSTVNFILGIITTLLVFIAWVTNLVAKPHATAFGGTVAAIGLLLAYSSYRYHRKQGRAPVIASGIEPGFPVTTLALLSAESTHNDAVISAALGGPERKAVVFLYTNLFPMGPPPELYRFDEPHLHDEQACVWLGKANHQAQEAQVPCRFLYRRQDVHAPYRVWRMLRPHDTIVAPELVAAFRKVHVDQTYEEVTTSGIVIHLIKEKAA